MTGEPLAPAFSIILPVRNGGDYVRACLDSLLGQRYPSFNVIVLENCSTDGTREWLESLDDARVKVIPAAEPLSMEANWSRIAGLQTNEFITIVSHDDLLDANYLDVMRDLIDRHPRATLYQAHFRFIDARGSVNRRCLPMAETAQAHEFVAKQLARTIDSTATGYVFRRSTFDAVGGFPQYHNLIFGDWELWVKLAHEGYLATAITDCFAYREHASASALTNARDYQVCLAQYLAFLARLASRNSNLRDVLDRYGADYLRWMCEGLVYRTIRGRMKAGGARAGQVVADFRNMARELLPTQNVEPLKSPHAKAAVLLDRLFLASTVLAVIETIKLHVRMAFPSQTSQS